MKQAIVTGATGFIGTYFVEYLINKGLEVLAIGRKDFTNISEFRRNKLKDATYLKIDMKDILSLEDELSKIEWSIGNDCQFINLAWFGIDKLSDLNIEAQFLNVSWCVDAMDIAHKIGCNQFVQIGTMEEAFTYRYLAMDHKESGKYNRHTVYSVAKIAAKRALKIRAVQIGMDLIYVLHSHVMAPDDDKDSFLQVLMQKLIKGDELIMSNGEQLFDVVSARDCAHGYYLICNKGKSGSQYWVGSGHPKKLKEYVNRMYKLFPSSQELQYGKLPYNDVILREEDFSITNLVEDTGYSPIITYEESVKELHEYLTNL